MKKSQPTIEDRVRHGEVIDLSESLKEIEVRAILAALETSNGIKAQAARMLSMEVTTLHMKLKRLKIAA